MTRKPLIHDPEDKITGWCVFGIAAVLAIVIGACLVAPGCTAEQLAPFRKAFGATTRVSDNGFVVAAAASNPYTLTADRIVSYVANAGLALLLVMEKKKAK